MILLIDFDSTFITRESLDELATFSLAENPNKEKILQEMKDLTNQGMSGEIPFDQSLLGRLALFKTDRTYIDETITFLQNCITPSILRNKQFFIEHHDSIYIISSGFKELIVPIVKPFGITENHVFGNNFLFERTGNVVGIDTKNPLSQTHGKVKVAKQLALQGDLIVIGDGYTDYQIKEAGLSKTFVAFTENIKRKTVVSKADYEVTSFDEFLLNNSYIAATQSL